VYLLPRGLEIPVHPSVSFVGLSNSKIISSPYFTIMDTMVGHRGLYKAYFSEPAIFKRKLIRHYT
jgi:hypothetical protein